VSNGEIVSSGTASQFAETLKPEDMLGDAPLTVDSDKAANLAHDYAEANGLVVTSMNYDLKKDGPDAAPAWTISCLDDKGDKLGQVVVTAGKGNVVSHDGFTLEPAPEPTPGETPRRAKDEPRFETYAQPEVATADVTTTRKSGPAAPAEEEVETTPGHHHHRRSATQKPSPSALSKTFQNVGRTLQKYNPF
jgi:hypothetical protein